MNTEPQELIIPINKDKDSSISEGFLNPSSNSLEHQEKQEIVNNYSNQFKALFLKSCSLQFKQIGTNICQVHFQAFLHKFICL